MPKKEDCKHKEYCPYPAKTCVSCKRTSLDLAIELLSQVEK